MSRSLLWVSFFVGVMYFKYVFGNQKIFYYTWLKIKGLLAYRYRIRIKKQESRRSKRLCPRLCYVKKLPTF